MGTGTLVDKVNGNVIDQSDPNDIHAALEGDFVGRDASGAPTVNQNLGTVSVPWGTARLTNLILNGLPIEPDLITAQPNRVISGAVRVTSDFPLYLIAAGATATFLVLGNTVNLLFDVNGSTTEITSDLVKSGLTVAPAANNTCLINDTNLSGQDTTRFLGENGTGITVDNMGSELTSKIGEFVALLNQTSGEIIYCRIASATRIDYARRGFFFDTLQSPLKADVLNNNEVLQLLSLGFIFAENDGTTIDVTYRNPVISGDQPSSPQTGDYWYDLAVKVWKRYNGASFAQINRTYIGLAVIDTSVCIATRSEYFGRAYKNDNNLKVLLNTVDIIVSDKPDFLVSVDGNAKRFDFGFFTWNASTDFESGVVRTVSRDYWLYITEDSRPIISDKKPYDLRGYLRGWYHPAESWRAVAQVFNNASNEFELVSDSDLTLEEITGVLFPLSRIILSNGTDASNDIDFSGGKFSFDDETGRQRVLPLTKQLDANFVAGDNAGGLDTGSKAADSTYHCYAIYDPVTNLADYLFSLSATLPTMPTGFTKKRLIGSILVDSVPDIRLFKQTDKTFTLQKIISEIDFSGSISATRALLALTGVPLGRKVNAMLLMSWRQIASTANTYSLRLTDPDDFDDIPTITANPIFNLYLVAQSSQAVQVNTHVVVTTDILAQFGYRRGGSAGSTFFQADSMGWQDFEIE